MIVIRYADRRARIVSRETCHGPTGRRPAPEVDAKFDDTGFGEIEAVFSKSQQGVCIWIVKPADDTSADPCICATSGGRQTVRRAVARIAIVRSGKSPALSSQGDSPQCLTTCWYRSSGGVIIPRLNQRCPARWRISFLLRSPKRIDAHRFPPPLPPASMSCCSSIAIRASAACNWRRRSPTLSKACRACSASGLNASTWSRN